MGKLKVLLRRLIYLLSGRMSHLNVGVKGEKKWFGNAYGGFYVVTSLMKPGAVVYSFGIGEDISFDTAIIEKYDCQVFGFDPTPKSINWLSTNQTPANFQFFEYGIGKESKEEKFFLPKNPNHVSGSAISQTNVSESDYVSVQLKTLGDILSELGHTKVDVLKMDVEGTEYDVLPGILESQLEVDQILVEFHERFFPNGKEKTKEMLALMRANGYEIFGISPSFEEVSFVKVDALK